MARVGTSSPNNPRELLSYLREWFDWYSVPEEMTTDVGPHFTSSEAEDFFDTWGVQHHVTSAYNCIVI